MAQQILLITNRDDIHAIVATELAAAGTGPSKLNFRRIPRAFNKRADFAHVSPRGPQGRAYADAQASADLCGGVPAPLIAGKGSHIRSIGPRQ